MFTRFFTNNGEQTLFKKFRGVFENNPDIEKFDALVGYLRTSGYFAIRPFLENVPHIRILVGINVDAIMADYHRRGLLFLADPTKALNEFRTWLRNDIQTAEYKREIETGILQFVDDVIAKKIELRAHPTKRLHAKIYIFRPKGFNQHKTGAVITGSSNLLWDKASADASGLRATQSTFVTGIESHANLMLADSPDRTAMESKTPAELRALVELLRGTSAKDNPKCVLRDW